MNFIERIISMFVRGADRSARSLILTFKRPTDIVGAYLANKYNEQPKIGTAFASHIGQAVRIGQDWMLGINPQSGDIPWNPLIPWAGRETPSTEKWITRIEGKIAWVPAEAPSRWAPFAYDMPGTPGDYSSFEFDALERLRADLERKYETLRAKYGDDNLFVDEVKLSIESITANYGRMPVEEVPF